MKLHTPFADHTKTNYIRIDRHLCEACWTCIEACPKQVLGKVDLKFHRHAHVDAAKDCVGCAKCIRACPHGAISRIIKEEPAHV